MNWELLLKYINKETDAGESMRVQSWLNEQSENRHLLHYLQKRREQLQQPIKQTDIQAQWVLLLDRIFENGQTQSKPGSFKGYWLMGIAASLLIVSLLVRFYFTTNQYGSPGKTITLQTPVNSRGKLTLPDGSQVYMAPDSRITYSSDYGLKKRELHIKGEAFFNIKHDVKHPFIIHATQQLDVTVLGTSFNVYSRTNNAAEVKVATGLVGITINKQNCFLKAGEQLRYQAADQLLVTGPVDQNDAAALQNESLFFKDNNADEIAEKLHRWYNINVEVLPDARKHPRFSGEMKDTGLSNLLKGLSYATRLNYRFKNTNTIQLF